MPVGNILVGNARSDVEHDNTALAIDVVTITETTELLLAGSVPDIKLNVAEVLGARAGQLNRLAFLKGRAFILP